MGAAWAGMEALGAGFCEGRHLVVSTRSLIRVCWPRSTQQVLHLLDQGLCPLTPGDTIQTEIVRFIVVAALNSKGGEGPQRQKRGHIHLGLLQKHEQTGKVMAAGWFDSQMLQPGLERSRRSVAGPIPSSPPPRRDPGAGEPCADRAGRSAAGVQPQMRSWSSTPSLMASCTRDPGCLARRATSLLE